MSVQQMGPFGNQWVDSPQGVNMNRGHLIHTQSVPAFVEGGGPRWFSPQSMSQARLDSCAQSLGCNRSPASGSPKSCRREGNIIPPELQGVSVKELVKALGKPC